MLARSGSNTVRSRVIDDDGNVYADWWVICVITLISVARKETDGFVTGPGFSRLPKIGNGLLYQPPSAVKSSIVPLPRTDIEHPNFSFPLILHSHVVIAIVFHSHVLSCSLHSSTFLLNLKWPRP